jgi:plasmid stabilization system protein ParE
VLFRSPYGRYLIFYREHETTLRIKRVMHSARDIAGDDFELDD